MVSLAHHTAITTHVPFVRKSLELKLSLSLFNGLAATSLSAFLVSFCVFVGTERVIFRSAGAVGMFLFGAAGWVSLAKGDEFVPLATAKRQADIHLVGELVTAEFNRKFDQLNLVSGQNPADVSGWVQGNDGDSGGIELFDWERFNTERNDFPHVAIAGKTGGGKSYLAEFLATLFEGVTIAVSPHWQKGDFTSADLVVGWGRNTGDEAKYEYSFADILTGKFNVSVGGFMYALLQEMDRRYQLDPKTQEYVGANDPEIVVILDEFNLYANLEGLPAITKQLLREARKVRIRLIPLVQGTEVKAMGVEGEGQLREQLTFIRVKNKAKEFVNAELSKHRSDEQLGYWQMVNNFISGSKYSCFVEDQPAQIPDLTEWKKLQPPLANLAGFDAPQVPTEQRNQDDCSSVATTVATATEIAGTCPHCHSHKIKWHSQNAGRKQCNDCGKTWTVKQDKSSIEG